MILLKFNSTGWEGEDNEQKMKKDKIRKVNEIAPIRNHLF